MKPKDGRIVGLSILKMNSRIRFFSCLLLGAVAIVNGARADTYTIDMRQYVDPGQYPYNAVLRLRTDGGIDEQVCSSVVTKDGLILTANHCIRFGPTLYYVDFNGKKIQIAGIERSEEDDFAILIPSEKVEYGNAVELGSKFIDGADIEMAGYGTLKILSDEEINRVRHEFASYLRQRKLDFNGHNVENEKLVALYEDAYNINMLSDGFRHTTAFIDFFNNTIYPLLDDGNRLKTSKCQLLSSYPYHYCQGWGGNSGGPLLYKTSDGTWQVLGLASKGNYTISDNQYEFGTNAGVWGLPAAWVWWDTFSTAYKKALAQLDGAGH